MRWGLNQNDTLKDRDVVVNLSPVALCNAFTDPNDVATFLLLQLEEGVEDPKVELLHERILVQPHLLFKEFILQGFLPRVGTSSLKALLVLSVVLGQLRAKGVDRDDERPPISLKSEYLAHHVRCLPPDVQAEVVEGLKVGLIQGVPDYLNIHLIKILLIY